jgi:hypothetical protein
LKSVRNGRQERSTSAWRAKGPERIYRKDVALPAIRRYHVLLMMTFKSNIFKVVETEASQIYRFANPVQRPPKLAGGQGAGLRVASVGFDCACGGKSVLQVDFGSLQPLQPNHIRFPQNNRLKCLNCGLQHDIAELRKEIESKVGEPIVF